MNLYVVLLLVTTAFFAGRKYDKWRDALRQIVSHIRNGTCFRYQKGPQETHNGTRSHFCLRCGQPAGYHGMETGRYRRN